MLNHNASPVDLTTRPLAGPITASTAHLLIDHLRATRPELVHFAGAAHRDPMALECPDPEVAAPAARIYTPDSTGRCMVCGRPGGEHSRSTGWDGDPKLCPPAELAARRCETDAAIGSPVEVVDVDPLAPACTCGGYDSSHSRSCLRYGRDHIPYQMPVLSRSAP
jgi:hypothetical protein